MTNFRLFKFDKNSTKFSKQVEDTVGKGEIARYKQFLPFPPSDFKRLFLQTCKNQGLFGKGLIYQIQSIPDLKNDVCLGEGRKHGG